MQERKIRTNFMLIHIIEIYSTCEQGYYEYLQNQFNHTATRLGNHFSNKVWLSFVTKLLKIISLTYVGTEFLIASSACWSLSNSFETGDNMFPFRNYGIYLSLFHLFIIKSLAARLLSSLSYRKIYYWNKVESC